MSVHLNENYKAHIMRTPYPIDEAAVGIRAAHDHLLRLWPIKWVLQNIAITVEDLDGEPHGAARMTARHWAFVHDAKGIRISLTVEDWPGPIDDEMDAVKVTEWPIPAYDEGMDWDLRFDEKVPNHHRKARSSDFYFSRHELHVCIRRMHEYLAVAVAKSKGIVVANNVRIDRLSTLMSACAT